MHPHAMTFCEMVAEDTKHFEGRGLDLGGFDVNGSARDLWPNITWSIIDPKLTEQDIHHLSHTTAHHYVSKNAEDLQPETKFVIVLCTEVFEHTPNWPRIIDVGNKALVKDGIFVATCAATGRVPHSIDGDGPPKGGEYYKNLKPDELGDYFYLSGLTHCYVQYNPATSDNYIYAIKP